MISASSPNVFWLDVDELALAPGSPVQRLPLAGGEVYGGNAKGSLRNAEPFAWLPAKGG